MNSSVFKPVRRAVGLLLLGGNIVLGSSLVLASSAQAMPDWLNQILRPGADQTVSQGSAPPRSTPPSTPPNATGPAPASPTNSQQLSNIRFSCQTVNGQSTVMYSPQSQPGKYYAWANPTGLGGGWTPERRCNEISRRLEFYRPDGLLELQTGVENGYNTVCVTTEAMSSCRIVLTVPPGQSPVAIRDRIFNNLLVADSGEQTTAATAYQDNGNGILGQIGQALGINLGGGSRSTRQSPSSINLRPFLDAADGGTGARLQNSAPAGGSGGSGTRLNPGNFR